MATPEKLSTAYRNFESNLTKTYRSGWDQYWSSVDRFVRDPSSLSEIQKDYVSFLSQTVPAQMISVLEAGTQYYTAIVESGSQLVKDAYSKDTYSRSPAGAGPTASQAADISEFAFEGYVGDSVVRRFLMTNNSASAQAIAVSVSSFQNDAGQNVAVPVVMEPSSFLLEASQEKVLTCSIVLPPELATGTDYIAIMQATGLPMKIRLRVRSLGMRDVPSEPDDEIVILAPEA